MASTVQAKLDALEASFGELQTHLEPLLSQGLPETLLGLETIQQAKLQTLLPYLLYDLIFVFLKSRGVDPRTHPVVAELERVKQYFNKIAAAEKDGPSSSQPTTTHIPSSSASRTSRAPPSNPTTTVDKEAVGRFIKHAIASVRPATLGASADAEAAPSTFVAPRVTSKMIARAEYEKDLREGGESDSDSEVEPLAVFNDDEGEGEGDDYKALESLKPGVADILAQGDDVDMEAPLTPKRDVKGKGKARMEGTANASSSGQVGKKRRRTAIDPFTGHLEDAQVSASDLPKPQKVRSKKSRHSAKSPVADDLDASPSSVTPMTAHPAAALASKQTRKKSKKKAPK